MAKDKAQLDKELADIDKKMRERDEKERMRIMEEERRKAEVYRKEAEERARREAEIEHWREIQEASEHDIDLDDIKERKRLEREKERAEEKVIVAEEKKTAEITAETEAGPSRAARAWNFTKKAGKGVGRGAAWAGKGIGKGAVGVGRGAAVVGSAGAGLMTGLAAKAGRGARYVKERYNIHKEKRGSDGEGLLTFLFWLSVLFHLLFALMYTNVGSAFGIAFLTTAMISTFTKIFMPALAVMAFLVFLKMDGFDAKTLFICIAITIGYAFVPFISIPALTIGAISLPGLVAFLIAIIPVWPLYISSKGDFPVMSSYMHFWIVILVLIFLYKVVTINPSALPVFQGSPQGEQAGQVFTLITAEVHNIWDKAVHSITNIPGVIQNRTGINIYTGMIEDNRQEPVGLYIEKVRPAEKYFYVGSPVVAWADIRGKSLVKESEIGVKPSCFIENIGYSDEVIPSRFSLLGEEYNSFKCTFNNLSKGNYRLRANAAFNFETWAYVTYTFVDIEVKRSYELGNKNINQLLDIPSLPVSIYTNGPVSLGMGTGIPQPIGIDTQYNTREPILGVTIDNRWTDGGIIEKVNSIVVQVPDDFDLVKCDRENPQISEGIVPGYVSYTFENFGDPRLGYQSVTCFLHIKEARLKSFMAGSPKVQKTFVSKASYMYNLQKAVSISVRE
jgi:hypothetical protein